MKFTSTLIARAAAIWRKIEPNRNDIAAGAGIRDLPRLRERFGDRRWRKLKGVAMVRLPNGQVRHAEVHRYEAHGIGRRRMKIKRLLD